MSVLDALDATRICARRPVDAAAWATPAPTRPRPAPAPADRGGYSWWSLVRNPQAMLLTGMVGGVLATDRLLATGRRWATTPSSPATP